MKPPTSCRKCEKDAEKEERRKQKAFELKEQREKAEREYDEQMMRLNEQIELRKQAVRDERLAHERQAALQQRQKDLETATRLPNRHSLSPPQAPKQPEFINRLPPIKPEMQNSRSTESSRQATSSSTKPDSPTVSPSKLEWERQKSVEKASNAAIDSLMDMVGLEVVKAQVLAIKAKIDVSQRQDSDVKDERFNISLLGNPGTGEARSTASFAVPFFTNLSPR